MKRLSLSLLTLCMALQLTAGPVSKQTALYSAQNYMLAKGKNIVASQKPFKAPRKAASAQQTNEEDAYYYVFNAGNDGGYVIVSGDDRVEPILGYVDKGSFDPNNIPENMRSWLQLYADQIKFIIDNDIQPGSPLIQKRNKIRGTKHSVGELLTTRWNQGRPYNLTCPDYYLEKDKEEGTSLPLRNGPATGCTATAMAQVMNFYRYPEKTKAVIPSYSITYTSEKDGSRKTVTQTAIPRNTPIDWDNMRDTYSWSDGHKPNAQDSAVANLMHYCGQSVNMHYGPSSGANFSAYAYTHYFGYDNSCYVGERYDYFIDDWFDMIYNEIEQGYPVLMSGFSSGGGHAFVLDGFDGDNLFHLNWGWGGGSNGWFLVGILNPGDNSGIGASSSSDGYSMSQRALFNLRLPDNINADTYLFAKDVSAVNTSIKATFENRTGANGSFTTAIVRYDENDNLVVVGTQQSISNMADGASSTKTFSIRNKLPEGTYKLSPASKAARSKVWKPKYDLRNHYIEAVVDSTGVVLTPVDINNGNSISIDTIVFPGLRIVGQEQEVKVTYRNNGNEYFREVRLFASKTQNKVYVESKSMVAIRNDETVDVSYFFKPEETGTYNLWFCTGSDGGGQVGTGTMEVVTEAEAEANKAKLTVNSYTVTNLANGVAYGKRIVGKAAIKNNKNVDFHGGIRLQIWNQPNSSGSAWGGSSHTYNVDILAGKIATVDFDFDGLSENNKYYISASYVNQSGSLNNGGVWDLGGWEMKAGIASWKTDGTIVGKQYTTSIATLSSVCGVYADCSKKINRMTPNKNPNTIYAYAAGMEVPATLDGSNVVSGKHASNINLVSDEPYYLPVTFDADTASFTYTFAETEDGSGWHAFTMPFEADSIFIDDIPVSLEDSLNHFWIYEFAAEDDNGDVIFRPATILRGATPYIIAGDAKMAGRSLVFRSYDVPFFKAGSDKMVVTSSCYQFHGNTYSPKVKDCYILNEEGTAFEYVTTTKTLPAMASYFTTNLTDELTPDSIPLPEIPASPVRKAVLDEMVDSVAIEANRYDELTLKRTFQAGWNTICLPFDVKNVEGLFGEGAKAYTFCGIVDNEIDILISDSIDAGVPYLIYIPEAITEDFELEDIHIAPNNVQSGYTSHCGAYFCGTYNPIAAGNWMKVGDDDTIYGLNADGTIVKIDEETGINGFRAYFNLQEGTEATAIHIFDSPDAISVIPVSKEDGSIYNLAGQRLSKPIKGINIIKGKKVATNKN